MANLEGKQKGAQAKDLQGWTTNPIEVNLEAKMNNSKGNNMGKVKDMGVINQGKKHEGKMFKE